MGFAFAGVVLSVLGVAVTLWVKKTNAAAARYQAMTPDEREKYHAAQASRREAAERERRARQDRSDRWAFGPVNPAMICPHCQAKGHIRTKLVDKKKGISGGKATAAILTGGVSLLATGLSRKEEFTQARCGNCQSVWVF
jgi:hypothetical protein